MALKDIHFPVGGIDRSMAYQRQPPYTTPESCNTRPRASFENRIRGGSRPGLDRAFYLEPEGGPVPAPWRMMANVTLVDHDGFVFWMDDFEGTAIDSSVWSATSWIPDLPLITPNVPLTLASVSELTPVAAVRDPLSPPNSETMAYAVEIYIVPWQAGHHGKYRLYAKMNDTAPDLLDEGVEAELVLEGASGDYSGTLKHYSGGVLQSTIGFTAGTTGLAQPGWFTLLADGDDFKCFWRGALIGAATFAGLTHKRIGFGMQCTSTPGICLTDIFRAQWYSSNIQSRKRILVASAAGQVYKETSLNKVTLVPTAATIDADRLIHAASRAQLLYIADYDDDVYWGADGVIAADGVTLTAASVADWTALGADIDDDVCMITNGLGAVEDGTRLISVIAPGSITLGATVGGAGNCAWTIRRGPKIFDPTADTLVLWVADTDKGQVPTHCAPICLYRDRLVMARHHLWYMSRQGAPHDWDYTSPITDVQRAMAGMLAEAGEIGEDILALAPHTDDFLIFGCEYSLWVMRGDPAIGGQIDNISHEIGIIDKGAWCYGSKGELIFLSRQGLFYLPPGANLTPVEMSRDKMPKELLNIDTQSYTVLLAYDFRGRGVHIYMTPTGGPYANETS